MWGDPRNPAAINAAADFAIARINGTATAPSPSAAPAPRRHWWSRLFG